MADPVNINQVPKLNLGLQETDEVFITRGGSGPYRVPASSFPWERKGDKGDPGGSWAPVLALVTDGARLVHRVVDWVGGTGEKPAALGYVGAAGIVATAAAAVDVRGAQGAAGWTPVLAVVEDGVRRVQQVVDWTGGAGDKPATLGYVGATGIVATAAAAVDVRGAQGVAGWAPVLAVVADGERRVQQVVDWTGGAGDKPATLGYVGAAGIVATAAAAVDVRGAQGVAGWAPVLAVVADGERRVQQVVDWTGGAGDKPATLGYVGAAGIVATAAAAVDVRGAQGVAGWAPVLAVVADGERRVQQIVDWVGGAGDKPATLGYVGATGIVATAAAAVDVRRPLGSVTAGGILASLQAGPAETLREIGFMVSAGGIYVAERPAEFASGNSFLSDLAPVRLGSRWESGITPESLVDTTNWTNTYFVDNNGGIDSNTGLSWAQRVRTVYKALQLAIAANVPSRILIHGDTPLPYYRQVSAGGLSSTWVSPVPIAIEAINGRVKMGPFDNLAWTLVPGTSSTYQVARSNAMSAYNPSILAGNGGYLRYDWASTYTGAGELPEGSWFTNGTTTYIRCHNNAPPTTKTARVYLLSFNLGWQCDAPLLLRGIDFEGGSSGCVRVMGGATNIVIADDCTFRYATNSNSQAGGTAYIDGAQILGCGLFAAFDCDASFNSKDGFNFHIEGSVLPTGLLVRSTGRFNGHTGGQSNNGFTTHDGVKAASIGCDWTNNYGTGSGHINDGTQVWSCGDTAGSSAGDIPLSGGLSFGAFGVWSGAAKLWLDQCRDIRGEWGVYQSGDAQAYLRGHRGSGRRSAGVLTY